MPLSMSTAEKKPKVDKSVSDFIVPLFNSAAPYADDHRLTANSGDRDRDARVDESD